MQNLSNQSPQFHFQRRNKSINYNKSFISPFKSCISNLKTPKDYRGSLVFNKKIIKSSKTDMSMITNELFLLRYEKLIHFVMNINDVIKKKSTLNIEGKKLKIQSTLYQFQNELNSIQKIRNQIIDEFENDPIVVNTRLILKTNKEKNEVFKAKEMSQKEQINLIRSKIIEVKNDIIKINQKISNRNLKSMKMNKKIYDKEKIIQDEDMLSIEDKNKYIDETILNENNKIKKKLKKSEISKNQNSNQNRKKLFSFNPPYFKLNRSEFTNFLINSPSDKDLKEIVTTYTQSKLNTMSRKYELQKKKCLEFQRNSKVEISTKIRKNLKRKTLIYIFRECINEFYGCVNLKSNEKELMTYFPQHNFLSDGVIIAFLIRIIQKGKYFKFVIENIINKIFY